MNAAALATASALLFREARLLDSGGWEAWANLYRPDSIFWVPAWLDEYQTTSRPKEQVSLIYHDTRAALKERIARIESRKSITALPLPRTCHIIANVEVTAVESGSITCCSTYAVHVFDPRSAKEHTRYGSYVHDLVEGGGEWMIARKVITLVNDKVPTALDFYSI